MSKDELANNSKENPLQIFLSFHKERFILFSERSHESKQLKTRMAGTNLPKSDLQHRITQKTHLGAKKIHVSEERFNRSNNEGLKNIGVDEI